MIGMFLPIFFFFLLLFVLFISAFIALFLTALVFVYEGYMGKPLNEIFMKAKPIALVVFLATVFMCCSLIIIYYSITPFYLP